MRAAALVLLLLVLVGLAGCGNRPSDPLALSRTNEARLDYWYQQDRNWPEQAIYTRNDP